MKNLYVTALFGILLLGSCSDLENAPMSERNTFMHFYEGAYSMTSANAEITGDGYIIAGTVNISGNKKASRIIVIKTDKLGQKQWETVIDGGVASNVKVVPGGYVVIGSNVLYNPNTGDISELENFTSRLIFLDGSGNVLNDISSKIETTENNLHVDYFGNAVTEDNNGNIITLGTFQEPGKSEYSYVTAIAPGSLDTIWSKQYNYIVRDYVNTKSVHYKDGKVIWGTSVTESLNAFNYSYLAVPVVAEGSTFINSNYYGQNVEQQSLKIRDIQAAPLGYAAIGTYSKPDGTNADIFFIRIDRNGTFVDESIRYFDGLTAAANTSLTAPSLTDVAESGEALTMTRDGGFILAGTLTTDEGKGIGNGGSDLWLIKIDGFGVAQWNKIMGGATNERVSSIRETEDGGFLICGTIQDGDEQSGGLSSIYLMKTDRNGSLRD